MLSDKTRTIFRSVGKKFIAFALIILGTAFLTDLSLRPIIESVNAYECQLAVSQLINKAVAEELASNPYLVENAHRLNDHVILAIHVELHVSTGITVAETQHGLLSSTVLQGGFELAVVLADATQHLQNNIVRHTRNVQCLLDGLADFGIDLVVNSE